MCGSSCLADLLKLSSMSVKQAAAVCGLSRKTFVKSLRGRRSFRTDEADKLLDALHIEDNRIKAHIFFPFVPIKGHFSSIHQTFSPLRRVPSQQYRFITQRATSLSQ